MKIERTKNAAKNIATGLGLKLFQTLMPFFMRTVMIRLLGVSYLGLNGLFVSILRILNLAELGVGAAMVFSMYRPVAEDDTDTICALMGLYRRYYRIIGLVIGFVGLALTPVIPSLISGDVPSELNVYVLYLMNLASTVLTYWLFAYKNCLLQAHQKTSVTNMIQTVISALQFGAQLVVLLIWRNYYLYVIVNLVAQAVANVTTAIAATRMYPLYKPKGVLRKDIVKAINQRVGDLFTAKVGAVVLNSVDTVVISSFLGLTILAVYQNYYFILTSVTGVIEIVFSSILGGLGNSYITETREKYYQDLKKFTFLFLWLTSVCTCCFLGMYQPFMRIWVGEELMLGIPSVLLLVMYFYIYTLIRLLNVYKDAAGLWHEDRLRPLITAVVNLLLNLLWVRRWGINGVLLSTIVALLFVGMPWVVRNVFTLLFDKVQLRSFLKQIFIMAGCALLSGAIVLLLCFHIRAGLWGSLVACTCISVIVPNFLFFVVFRNSPQFIPAVHLLDRFTGYRLKLSKWLIPRDQ